MPLNKVYLVFIKYQPEQMAYTSLSVLCEDYNINYNTLMKREKDNWIFTERELEIK